MSAIRLARGFTGRTKIIKFAGCYHGHADGLLAAAGSGVATLGLPDSPGVTAGRGQRDDRAAVQRPRPRSRRRSPPQGDDIARDHHRGGAGQHGRRAARGRASTPASPSSPTAHGALLILDEVMTGFRVVPRRLGRARTGRRRPVHLRQGDGRRAARRRRSAVARRSWASSPRPGRSTRPARCPGTRWPAPPGWPRCARAPTRCTPGSTRPPRRSAGWPRDALTAAGVPHRLQTRRQHVLDLLHRRRRCTDYDDARGPRTSTRSGRSSTRCWPAACTCRRRRSRPGSSRPPSTTTRWRSSRRRCRPRGPGRGGRAAA